MPHNLTTGTDAPRRFTIRGLAFLFLPIFTVSLGYGAVLPILPLLMERLHASTAGGASALHAGLLTGLYIAAFVIAAPLWGKVTDARGPRPVLLMGLLGFAVATVWFGWADSLASGYLARFVAGVFAAGLLPATSALIVRDYRGEEQSSLLVWVNAAMVLGFLIGPVLSGSVHDLVAGVRPGVRALHATAVPIWTTSLLALAAMIGVVWGLRERVCVEPVSDAAAAPRTAPRITRTLLALSACAAFGLGVFEVGLSLQSQQVWRWSLRDLGWLFAVCSLVMLAIQLGLFVRLRRALRAEVLIIGGFLAMAAGFTLLTRASVYGAVVLVVALVAFGSGVLGPTLSLAMAKESGGEVGTAIGFQNAAGNLGQAAGSAAAGVLFSVFSTRSFGIVGVSMVVLAMGVWAIARARGGLLRPASAALDAVMPSVPGRRLQRNYDEDRQ
jgi:MFS family permease